MEASTLWPVAGAAPRQVRLGPGYYLICVSGTAWVTRQSADRDEAARDTVLAAGDEIRSRDGGVYFVSALRARPAWLAVRPPASPHLSPTMTLEETNACPT